ncbi:MAG: pyruvate kinase [Patescibacteria group bacterium]
MDNRTKIIATLGPACSSPTAILNMTEAGMDVCRLNFSHGTYAEHAGFISTVRTVSKKTGKHIAVMQDLQGPRMRVGDIGSGMELTNGSAVSIPVRGPYLHKDIQRGDRLLIDDGMIEVTVLKKHRGKLDVRVARGGFLKSNKGINAPDTALTASALTEKDMRDIAFGVKHGVDFVALSFVKNARDIERLRAILRRKKSHAHIVAKIERREALDNLEEIIIASDAVMVARGDLGIEVRPERVPVLQKKIIALANKYGKPVIVATQMLQSMTDSPRPTRAEVSDAATAIFDHADAFMLSNETAAGKYPVEAVRVLRRVAGNVEGEIAKEKHLLMPQLPSSNPIDAVCANAATMAASLNAKYIIALTESGHTARELAKYRPSTPILAITPHVEVARQLSLVWGAVSTIVSPLGRWDGASGVELGLKKAGLVKKGDTIVICSAAPMKKQVSSIVIH